MQKEWEYKTAIKILNAQIEPIQSELHKLQKQRDFYLQYFRVQKQRGKISEENYKKLLTF